MFCGRAFGTGTRTATAVGGFEVAAMICAAPDGRVFGSGTETSLAATAGCAGRGAMAVTGGCAGDAAAAAAATVARWVATSDAAFSG